MDKSNSDLKLKASTFNKKRKIGSMHNCSNSNQITNTLIKNEVDQGSNFTTTPNLDDSQIYDNKYTALTFSKLPS